MQEEKDVRGGHKSLVNLILNTAIAPDPLLAVVGLACSRAPDSLYHSAKFAWALPGDDYAFREQKT